MNAQTGALQRARPFRLGCDVGGTFTDFVVLNTETGAYDVHKVLTTHEDPSLAIAAGAAELDRRQPGTAAGTDYIIHGTTLVINAILKRRGAPTALITTKGFADILAIRREIRYDIYDLNADYPQPLIEQSRRRELDERIAANGEILTPLAAGDVEALLAQLVAEGIRSIAVCFLHSYINPVHEEMVARIAAERFPELPVSLSSRVLREIREFERTSTTAINAYVRPLMAPYIQSLEDRLGEHGYARRVYLMLSGGGIIAPGVAKEFPVRLVESGPVGGALAAAHLGQRIGLRDLIVFDVGGTTAKTTLLKNGHLTITNGYEVDRVHRFKKGSGTPVAVPCVDLIEIGTGGGSIAGINQLGLLQVGPQSAESHPGPACYGLGGEHPTVTDANLVLGYLDGGRFMGGEMSLDVAAAEASIERALAGPLNLSTAEAAWAVHDVANESMASSIRMFMAEKGVDPAETAMLAFGGGGPLHAVEVSRKLGARRIIVPQAAGVYAALGFLVAPVAYEVSRSQVAELHQMDAADLEATFAELESLAGKQVGKVVGDAADISYLHELDVCYSGQGSTVRVNADGLVSKEDLKARFSEAYSTLYGHSYDDLPINIVTVRVTASVSQSLPEIGGRFPEGAQATPLRHRRAFSPVQRDYVDYAVYEIGQITAGTTFSGPAFIEDKSSTFAIHEGATFTARPKGWMDVRLEEEE